MAEDSVSSPQDFSVDNEQQFSCVYFGFASNLSPRSLQQRCPGSIYIGLARLHGWRFIVTELGFGNIILGDESDEVYGSLHFLTKQHEAALDKSEEVPSWHEKRTFKVTRAPARGMEVFPSGEELNVMTYVDVQRTKDGNISKEYIFLMRKAVSDGTQIGVPPDYFQKYWAKYLPEDASVGTEDRVVMQRTVQVDREDTRYVPRELLNKNDSGA